MGGEDSEKELEVRKKDTVNKDAIPSAPVGGTRSDRAPQMSKRPPGSVGVSSSPARQKLGSRAESTRSVNDTKDYFGYDSEILLNKHATLPE